ncbi:MAG: hypothetical protein JWP87_461 [Labilithrix sp.]|nr:hypothetical protein [Labilithrix sp.]
MRSSSCFSWFGAVACGVLSFAALSCATVAPQELGPAAPSVEFVTRQEVLTPLPLRVRMPLASGTEHVVVLVRTWGSRGWHPMELARTGQTWEGEVSCREVSTVTGDTKYFFVALDAEGNPVGGSGSPDWPHVATIVGKLQEGAQSLPGGVIPMRCHDPADCPPDFPGCPAYAMRRKSCRTDRDCAGKQRCGWDAYCEAPARDSSADGFSEEAEQEELEAAVRSIRKRYGKTASSSR